MANCGYVSIIDIQIKNFTKKLQEPDLLMADKQLNVILRYFYRTLLMFVSYVRKKPKMIFPWIMHLNE